MDSTWRGDSFAYNTIPTAEELLNGGKTIFLKTSV
jgi:hypothetical protein